MSATTLPQSSAKRRSEPTRLGGESLRARPRAPGSLLGRIVLPVIMGLAFVTALAYSSAALSLFVFFAAFSTLALAALRLGHDSREASGWTRAHRAPQGDPN